MRLYTALKGAPLEAGPPDWNEIHAVRFREAMDDDFNTPEAIAALFDLANEVNRTHAEGLSRQLRALGGVLGFLARDSEAFLQGGVPGVPALTREMIESLVEARNAAKKVKNYAEADRIRKELAEAGIVLEDSAHGTTWRRA